MYITVLWVWYGSVCRKFLVKLDFWQQKQARKQQQQQQILPNSAWL